MTEKDGRKSIRPARVHYAHHKIDKSKKINFIVPQGDIIEKKKIKVHIVCRLPLHLIYEAAFQTLSIPHSPQWRYYNPAGFIPLTG